MCVSINLPQVGFLIWAYYPHSKSPKFQLSIMRPLQNSNFCNPLTIGISIDNLDIGAKCLFSGTAATVFKSRYSSNGKSVHGQKGHRNFTCNSCKSPASSCPGVISVNISDMTVMFPCTMSSSDRIFPSCSGVGTTGPLGACIEGTGWMPCGWTTGGCKEIKWLLLYGQISGNGLSTCSGYSKSIPVFFYW